MQRIIIVLFILDFFSSSYSQDSCIGKNNFFKKNVTYYRNQYDPSIASASILTDVVGNDLIWDLSPIRNEHRYRRDTLQIVSFLDTFPFFNSYYDTSNILLKIHSKYDGEYYLTFLEENNAIHYVGANPFGATGSSEACFFRFSGQFPLELQNYMDYGYKKYEDFKARWMDAAANNDIFTIGNITTIIDGHGKIVSLNGDTINDVFRLKKIIHCVDSNLTDGPIERNDTVYSWYSAHLSGPLISIERGWNPINHDYFSGVLVYDIDSSRILSIVNTLSHNPAADLPVRIIQNPFTGFINLQFNFKNPDRVNWRICSLTGQVIKSSYNIFVDGQGTITINGRDLPSSPLLIKIFNGHGIHTGRLMHLK